VLIQCFKNVFSYIEKEKNLVLGKKISAQPTASKKIETPLRIGVVFKGMGFGMVRFQNTVGNSLLGDELGLEL
jgi:hypothetical protein